jgi:hypothetical protein
MVLPIRVECAQMGMGMQCSSEMWMLRWKNAWRYVGNTLPIKDWREEFGNQALIVWAEGLGVNGIIALAV